MNGGNWCYSSLQVCRLRVALLDGNGSPDDGAANGYVTDAIINAKLGVEVEEGDEFTIKNGCGAICAQYKDDDRVKGATIGLELCHLDAYLISLLTGGSRILDLGGAGSGDTIGYELPGTDGSNPGVCLELWSKAWNGAALATPAFAGGSTAVYFHFVLPLTKFQLGELTLENGILKVPANGFGRENPRITSNGPFDDWPADVVSRGGITKAMGWFFDTSMPSASCAPVNVTSAAS